MQLRALMSARNGPTAFDLRCYVRENLIKFLQEKFPASLPQGRNRNIPETSGGSLLHDDPAGPAGPVYKPPRGHISTTVMLGRIPKNIRVCRGC